MSAAVAAYGWPFVALVLTVILVAVLAGVADFVRFSRDWDRKANAAARRAARRDRAERAQAMRRHPAGRRLPSSGDGFHGDARIHP